MLVSTTVMTLFKVQRREKAIVSLVLQARGVPGVAVNSSDNENSGNEKSGEHKPNAARFLTA